jgi:hypothetical protein
MNRKGAPWAGIIFGLVIVTALVIWFVFVIYPKFQEGGESFGKYLEEGDFDGDLKTNILDPCPCGTQNEKEIGSTGTSYCIADLTSAQCGCANLGANAVAKKQMKDDKTRMLFFFSEGKDNLPGKCLYEPPACRYLMQDNRDFFTIIDSGEDPCSGLVISPADSVGK